MKHIKKMKIDIDKRNFEVISSVQYDSNTRFLHINLLNGSVPFNLTGCSVKISGTKPDGTAIFNNCTVINAKEGFIEVELTEQMNAAPGTLKCELKLYSGSGVLTTKHFDIDVTASVTSKNVTSGNEFKALEEALSKVNNIDTKFESLTAETVKAATEKEIQKQIANGNMANLTIAPGSITQDKLSPNIKFGIEDGEVTTQKIANGAITKEKLDPNITMGVEDGSVNEDKLDEELVKKINKVDSVESKINAIITINENIGKSIVPASEEVQYANEYDLIAHKYPHNNEYCYFSFVFDVSKFKGQTVESHFQYNIETTAPIKLSAVQLNTINKLPPNPEIVGYLHTVQSKDDKQQIIMNSNMIMLQFGIMRTDGTKAESALNLAFNYFVNGEALKPMFAGPYFASDSATVNNARVGIKMVQDITTTNDKETEIVFSVKNINMKGATVKLSVDGNVTQKTFTASGEGYVISHVFEKITSYKCFVEVTESGGMTYKTNTFTVKSKDPNDISPSAIWVNANKIIIGGKTLTGKFEEIEELIRVLSSNLYKKKIVFIGDSICEQGTFINPLVQKTGCIAQNLELSGSGWIARSPENYYTRIDQIKETPDILVFYGSTNDLSVHNVGTFGDKDLTTYHGAIRGTLEKAINKYKHNTKYCIMTPLPTYYQGRGVRDSFVDEYGKGAGSTPIPLSKMSDILKEYARAFSIPCLDLYSCSNFFPIFPDGQITGDGVHLGSQQAPITTIQKFLESII